MIEKVKKIFDENTTVVDEFYGEENIRVTQVYFNEESAAQQICQLSQEKVEQTIKDDADRCAGYLKLAREECQERVERIFKEIEEANTGMWIYSKMDGSESHPIALDIPWGKWEVLKKKELK